MKFRKKTLVLFSAYLLEGVANHSLAAPPLEGVLLISFIPVSIDLNQNQIKSSAEIW